MLRHWFRIIRTVVMAVGVLFAFFTVIEVLRAYQTLYALHPWAGYAFLAAIAAYGIRPQSRIYSETGWLVSFCILPPYPKTARN